MDVCFFSIVSLEIPPLKLKAFAPLKIEAGKMSVSFWVLAYF